MSAYAPAVRSAKLAEELERTHTPSGNMRGMDAADFDMGSNKKKEPNAKGFGSGADVLGIESLITSFMTLSQTLGTRRSC